MAKPPVWRQQYGKDPVSWGGTPSLTLLKPVLGNQALTDLCSQGSSLLMQEGGRRHKGEYATSQGICVKWESRESQDDPEREALPHVSKVSFGKIVRNACTLCHSGEGFCVLAHSSKQNAKKDRNRLLLIELDVKNTFTYCLASKSHTVLIWRLQNPQLAVPSLFPRVGELQSWFCPHCWHHLPSLEGALFPF